MHLPYPLITAGVYWLLIVCWSVILAFYWREHRRLTQLSPMVGTMLVVVFLDGARTLLESVYFGTVATSQAGVISRDFYEVLTEPQLVLAPKLLNVCSALTIIFVLLYRWFPALKVEMEQRILLQQAHEELSVTHSELQSTHAELQSTHTALNDTLLQLQQAQEAQDALTHMIVHDMRTPLTSVITGLQTVQVVGPDPVLTPELVGNALSGADRLLRMVNDLLDINKMEAGALSLDITDVSLADVLSTASAMIDALIAEKSLEVSQELDGAPTARGDAEMLRRVLINLMGNAIKFSPDGACITVGHTVSDGMVRVTVIDAGPGIPAEHLERVFEKFHQVKPKGGNGGPSTGLGLTFCRMAVEAMGGAIGVTSELGQGSCFWFTVPVSPAAEAR